MQYGLRSNQLSLALTCNMQRNSLIFCTDLQKLFAVNLPLKLLLLCICGHWKFVRTLM